MKIICKACNYENVDNIEYCEACGVELTMPSTSTELVDSKVEQSALELPDNPFDGMEPSSPIPPLPEPIQDTPLPKIPSSSSSVFSGNETVKLISRLPNAPVQEFILDVPNLLIGRFDPDSGPVEVDLEGFPGEDTISRHHAEIYQEGGSWKIKDLGSTNGVFIKRAGETRYAARITTPQPLFHGDEVAIAKIRFLFSVD
jgi:pSer/pThr/pTyr-binding forkhead associated (FHA) protein